MSRLLTNRRLFVLLASFILLLVIAGLTLGNGGGIAGWPQRIAMDAENTLGSLVYRPVSALTGFLSGVRNLHDMYVENAELKSELHNYLMIKRKLADETVANAELSKMVGFQRQEQGKLQMLPAHVVGRDPSQWNSEITIDVGRTNGVHDNMAVISPDGSLVGRVMVAGEVSSKVVLITDTQLGDGVSAMVQSGKSEPFGVVVGSTSVAGALDMKFLSPIAQVKKGDLVVTSGLSSIFPKGLIIGTVAKVYQGLQGVTQSAVVEPSADLGYIQDVLVVTNGASS